MTFASDNRDWLEPYILDIAQRMGLTHWRVKLGDEGPTEGCSATVHIQGESRRAVVLIGEPDDAEDLRDSVVHELMHIHLHEMEAALLQTEQHFNPAAWDIVTRNHHNQLEQAICAITLAWADLLPLPVMPEEARQAA